VLQDVADGYWIIVGEREDVRGELVEKIALRSLPPTSSGCRCSRCWFGWRSAGAWRRSSGWRELIRTRDPDKLTPLELAGLPQELEPMVAALNRLLQQLNTLLEREKRFLADAAHELRTPLAVLRIHAQNALDAPDPADRTEALGQMLHGVDRATRLVTQLLTLARLEPNAAATSTAGGRPARLRPQRTGRTHPPGPGTRQDLMLNADDTGDYRLQADGTSLGVLLQNLVGNAIQYTPPHGRIQVQLKDAQDSVELEVQDSGPGVAAAMRDKLFERFFREGGGSGAGLGLSIVQRIVELHRGSIILEDSPLGGLASGCACRDGRPAEPLPLSAHSCRKASIGFRLAARRAGK
jgi:two-component system, OmpR family, sensor histidine kinase QseC